MDAILIDNDTLMHDCWNLSAKDQNKEIALFYTFESFLAECKYFAHEIPVYIDSDLGDGIKGEIIAEEIYSLGFKNLYLATGYDAAQFSARPYLRGITGKMPPWV